MENIGRLDFVIVRAQGEGAVGVAGGEDVEIAVVAVETRVVEGIRPVGIEVFADLVVVAG